MKHLQPEQIYAFLEGGLSDEERRDIEIHTAECAGCRKALDDRQALEAVWAALPPVALPPDFASTVMRRILTKPQPKIWTWVVAALSALGALSVVVFGALGIVGTLQVSLVTGLNRSLFDLFGNSLVLGVKILKTAAAVLSLTGDLIARLFAGFSVMALSLSDEFATLAALVLVLSGLLAYGLRKRYLPGE